jgi:hypothetical protein
MKSASIISFLFIILSALHPLQAQKSGIKLDNQISTWMSFSFYDPVKWQAGARYIPTLGPFIEINENSKFDAEISFNTYGNLLFSGLNFDTASYNLKPYRLWLRYSTSHLEIRAGLQKINFGSANIFRPLMWFDKMDFRDPLQLTDGVYSLLGRYYFNNNINIWLWSLYGNKKVKGWEIAPSFKDIPEYGGRFQIPAGKGELAASYHHRKADFSELLAGNPVITETSYNEQMFAIDGKWDLGIGLWFEYVKKLNDNKNPVTGRWETFYTLGLDYTFAVGNGLSLMSEYFHYSSNPDSQERSKSNFTTLSLNYPLFLSHNISGLVYYNWDSHDWYRFINFQLKYDYLSFYLMAFWNPDKFALYRSNEGSNLFAGKGFQVMLVLDI